MSKPSVKSAMPKSKAKTAYGLLSEIRKIILDEPKRYNQMSVLDIRCDISDKSSDFPACGTVGCVAGWVTALKADDPNDHDAICFAEDELGLTGEQADALFDGEAAIGPPQTLEHAQAGAAHIAKFQKKYAAQLKAKKV